MNRFEERIEEGLGRFAEHATPSSTAFETFRTRIAEGADQSEVEIVMLQRNEESTNRRNVAWMVSAAAVVVAVLVAAILIQDDDTVIIDEPEVTTSIPEESASPTTVAEVDPTTTTEAAPDVAEAPTVARPDPAPAAAPSDLAYEDWLAETVVFAQNRHEGDWIHFLASEFGQTLAAEDGALARSDAYRFVAQCGVMSSSSSHLDEAPGLPENAAIAAVYQELLDLESVRWQYQLAQCDSVDHELVKAGLSRFPSLESPDFPLGSAKCAELKTVIEDETGEAPDPFCFPAEGAGITVDRELPEEFETWVDENWR